MRNKTNNLKNIAEYVYCSPYSSFFETKVSSPSKIVHFSSQRPKDSLYLSERVLPGKGSDYFNRWCDFVDGLSIDFSANHNESLAVLESNAPLISYKKTLSDFMSAVLIYKKQQEEYEAISNISLQSAKNFLYLIPVISGYNPIVSIDADTGCFTTTFPSQGNDILSALVTGNGEIHFSLVGQGVRIFKISGTAKIKNSRDFSRFNKVLLML